MRRSIIAGVDGSREATDAARVAASLARRLDCRLVLSHVVDDTPVFPCGDGWLFDAQHRRAIRTGTGLLRTVAAEIGEQTARKRVVLAGLIHGGLEDRLDPISREEDADLLVVGAGARGPFARTLLGTQSISDASSAACPVVAVPEGAGDPFVSGGLAPRGPIVCGIDESVQSERALIVSDHLAERAGLRVLATFIDQRGRWSDGRQGRHVEVSDPAARLVEAAERHRAPLIVVGTPGRGAETGALARQLLAIAPVSVVIVPPGAGLA